MRGEDGQRPVLKYHPKLATDPHFKDYILFHEYFHGDNGQRPRRIASDGVERTGRETASAAAKRSADIQETLMSAAHYDIIIIGSGAGGGTLALKLAPSGKRILILERGNYLPREKQNWDAAEVFVNNRYVSKDTWYDKDGKPFQPGVHYYVGGATKMYGAALFRLRKQDFTAHRTADGMTPDWPVGYEELEPYYTEAEKLFNVHGHAAMIRRIRPRARPIPIRPSATSRASRNSPTV